MTENRHKTDLLFVPVFVGMCFLAAFAGQFLSGPMPNEWYSQLAKPWFTPPGWIFAPVWTGLYTCMGVAAWLVWRNHKTKRAIQPLVAFSIQLLLNVAWSPLFFGLKNPGLAFAEIAALLTAIMITTLAFFRVFTTAGWLMIPYFGWVSFAAILNWSIWQLNR